jgi:hypothetical protein
MTGGSIARSAAGAVIALLFAGVPCRAGSAKEAVAAEVTRTRKSIAALPEAMFGADERRSVEAQIATIDDLLRAGRFPAALHVLHVIVRYVDAQVFRADHAAQIQTGMEALERDWKANEAEREGLMAAHEQAQREAAPAVARALSQSAAYESRIVHQASLTYGGQVGADAGYFYLGESRGLMRFALLCDRLSAGGGRQPALRPLAPFLARLEKELVREYGRDTASPQASAFARANGALKLARELDRERSDLGALYQYLLSERALGQALAPETAADPVALRRAADELQGRLLKGGIDHTLGELFVQLARDGIDRAATADDAKTILSNARVIIERVVPAYLQIAGEASP